MKMNRLFLPSSLNVIDLPLVKTSELTLESYQEDGINLVSEESKADLFGTTIPDVNYRGTVLRSVQLRYTRHCKYITLLRYLTGKLVFDTKRIERIDLLLMFDVLLTLQDLVEKDENFKRKYGLDLESLALILKSFNLKPTTTLLDAKKLSSQIKEKIPNFILPSRNLTTVWVNVQKMYYFTSSMPSGREMKKIPPKAYIGKGYTDKGTARKPELDNSPSWQEVAQTLSFDPEEKIL